MKRSNIIVIGGLLILAIAIRIVVLGGSPNIKLATAPPLSGTISQSLATPNKANRLSVEGKDYYIKSAKYFDGDAWAVVSTTTPANSNASWLVLHRQNEIFQVVLGPGTAFTDSLVKNLPTDVVTYLQNSGVLIYTPIEGANE